MDTNNYNPFAPLTHGASESGSEFSGLVTTAKDSFLEMTFDGPSMTHTDDGHESDSSTATLKQNETLPQGGGEYTIRCKLLSDKENSESVKLELCDPENPQYSNLAIEDGKYLQFAKAALICGERLDRMLRQGILNGAIDKDKTVDVSMKGEHTLGLRLSRAKARVVDQASLAGR